MIYIKENGRSIDRPFFMFILADTARRVPTNWLYIVILCRGGYYPPVFIIFSYISARR